MSVASDDPTVSPGAGTPMRRPEPFRRLLIRCPVTGVATDTGFELASLPSGQAEVWLVDCLECGQDHPWRVADAFLA